MFFVTILIKSVGISKKLSKFATLLYNKVDE